MPQESIPQSALSASPADSAAIQNALDTVRETLGMEVAYCRVVLNSGTQRIGRRLLPLNMIFRRQLAEIFSCSAR